MMLSSRKANFEGHAADALADALFGIFLSYDFVERANLKRIQ